MQWYKVAEWPAGLPGPAVKSLLYQTDADESCLFLLTDQELMEVAIVSNTSGLLWFHTFAVFLHLNLYSETKDLKKQKRSTFFLTEKKKMQWLQ